MRNVTSIKHLEHLPIDEFLDVIQNIDEYKISEKVDGASLTVGIDGDGNLYTSYGKQAHDKKYSSEEYQFKFSTVYRRAAHEALENISDMLHEHMDPKSEISLEIIFGKYPNVVPYTSSINTIVFLHNNRGTTNLSELADALDGKTTSVKLSVPVTTDGISIQNVTKTYAFQFDEVPSAAVSPELKTYIRSAIDNDFRVLKRFLAQRSGVMDLTVREVLEYNLRKKPEGLGTAKWQAVKEEIKKKREQFRQELQKKYYMPIKNKLLQIIVESNSSRFGSEEDWIEGVVLRHPYDNVITKLVNRELFLGAKEFLWDIREKLFSLGFSSDNKSSFRSTLLSEVGSLFGFPEYGTVHANKKLKSMGDTQKEVVKNFEPTNDISNKLLAIVSKRRQKLERFLKNYLSNYTSLNRNIQGRDFVYDGEIHNRTLQVFADMFEELRRLKRVVRENNKPAEVVKGILQPNFEMLGIEK